MSTATELEGKGWRLRSLDGFIQTAGPLWCRKADGQWHYGLLTEERHLNAAGLVHGGVLLTLFDHALSSIAWESAARRVCVTVQLNSQLHHAVKTSSFVEARARVVRRTRDLLFLEGGLFVGDAEVLTGQTLHKVMGT